MKLFSLVQKFLFLKKTLTILWVRYTFIKGYLLLILLLTVILFIWNRNLCSFFHFQIFVECDGHKKTDQLNYLRVKNRFYIEYLLVDVVQLCSIMNYPRWVCEAVIVSVSVIVVAAAGVLGAAAAL